MDMHNVEEQLLKAHLEFNHLKLGADPEFFLRRSDNKMPVSAQTRIGGTKSDPRIVEELGIGYTVQEDNVAVEIGIPPAATDVAWNESIRKTLDYVAHYVGLQGLELDFSAALNFPESELQSEGAREFGCEPDFNAWTMLRNPRPNCNNPNLRSAGGHIHFGFDDVNREKQLWLVRACDFFLGVPSVLMDDNVERRKLYGKAGCYRAKPYGVEYRTLSNFWTQTKELREWAFRNAVKAAEFLEYEDDAKQFLIKRRNSIEACINQSNKKWAEELLRGAGVNLD